MNMDFAQIMSRKNFCFFTIYGYGETFSFRGFQNGTVLQVKSGNPALSWDSPCCFGIHVNNNAVIDRFFYLIFNYSNFIIVCTGKEWRFMMGDTG